ncbi:hypothetical protein FACS189490_13740 [Clostridia bacterium]|nr:hypothetical protein FACS189490_13740 [Clostridia bacterium]
MKNAGGFIGGLLISLVSFFVLPQVIERAAGSVFAVSLYVIAGVAFCSLFRKFPLKIFAVIFAALICFLPMNISADVSVGFCAGILLYFSCGAVLRNEKLGFSAIFLACSGVLCGIAASYLLG